MPSIINSDDGVVSGTSGLKTTGGNDGLLNIQSNGSTVVAVTGSGISVTGTVSQTGVSTFAAGTVSAPSITFTGDTNTGIFSPAADTIAFTEGGVEAMRIDSSGNVGIGTSSPAGRLDVRSTYVSDTTVQVRFGDNTGGFLDFGGTAGANKWINASDGSTTAYPLVFQTGGTERARITSGGWFKAKGNETNYINTSGSYHEFRTGTGNEYTVIIDNTAASPYGINVRFPITTPNNTTNHFYRAEDSTNDKFIVYSSGTVTNRTGTYNSFSDLKLKQDVVDASSQWDDIKALRIVKYRLKDEVAADPNYPAYIGVIAQEVEQVSPGLVEDCADFENVTKTREVEKTREVTPAVLDDEGNEVTPAVTETYTETEEYTERVATGTVTKSVKSSIIYMKAVKALQEAMTRIETLETQNAAFEARLAALEAK